MLSMFVLQFGFMKSIEDNFMKNFQPPESERSIGGGIEVKNGRDTVVDRKYTDDSVEMLPASGEGSERRFWPGSKASLDDLIDLKVEPENEF
jgi:hypothetical protein